jgi:hypothetical protein
MLRRSAVAEIACVSVPGAVVLYAGAGIMMPSAETTAVGRHHDAGTGSVNVPGRRLEVGAARGRPLPPIAAVARMPPEDDSRKLAVDRESRLPLRRSAAGDLARACSPGAVVLGAVHVQ